MKLISVSATKTIENFGHSGTVDHTKRHEGGCMRKLLQRQAESMPSVEEARQAEQNLYSRLGSKGAEETTRIQRPGITRRRFLFRRGQRWR